MSESLQGLVVAVLIVIGLGFNAYVLAMKLVGPRQILLRWVAAIAALVWLATAVFHALIPFRLFTRQGAAAALIGLSLGAWHLGGRRVGLSRVLARDRTFARRLARLCLRSRYRAPAAVLILLAVPGLLRALLLPPLGWDSLTYHAVKAAMWVQSGGVDTMNGPGPWAYYQNMLAGGEVFLAWGLLPFHSDTLTPVVEVSQYLALGFCVMVLARRFGVREPFASTLAGFVLALPTVRLLVGSGYVEVGLLLSLTAGLVLGLAADRRTATLRVLAGGALGASAATKLPMVPLCGLLLLVFTVPNLVRGPSHARVCSIAGIAAFSVALCPWLILAFTRTGYPFSPIPITIAGLTLGQAPPELEWYLQQTTPLPSGLAGDVRALLKVFGLPHVPNVALGVLALVPVAAAPFGMRALVRRSPAYVLPVCVVIVTCLLGYFSPGLAVVRHKWVVSSSRFLLPAVVLAVVLSGVWCRRASNGAQAYCDVLLALSLVNVGRLSFYGFSWLSLSVTLLVFVGLVAVAILVWSAFRLRRPVLRWVCAFALLGGVIAGIGLLRTSLRDDLVCRDFAIHPTPRYWWATTPFVDRPGMAHRIAVTSGPQQSLDNWGAYPLMGRALQNHVLYVPVSEDGAIRHFGNHVRTRALVETADYASWCQRLRDRGVTEVMSFEPGGVELGWMGQHPEMFERLAGEAQKWGLFRVRGSRAF